MNDLSFLCNSLIAHRGFFDNKNGIPENSILAFKKAIENNYNIELDIHLLKDGKIVVFHDDNLKRMTGKDKLIKDCTYDELEKLRLLDTDEKIPLFEDVLNLIDGRVSILVELKSDVRLGMLEKSVLPILKKYKGKYAIECFRPTTIMWFRKNAKNIARGQLSCDFTKTKMNNIKRFVLSNMLFNFISKPDFIAYDVNGIDKIIQKYKNKMKIIAWTVRTKDKYEKYVEKCDNLICEKFDFIK